MALLKSSFFRIGEVAKILELFNNSLNRYDYEIIFTDNHSSDNTEKILNSCFESRDLSYLESKQSYFFFSLI